MPDLANRTVKRTEEQILKRLADRHGSTTKLKNDIRDFLALKLREDPKAIFMAVFEIWITRFAKEEIFHSEEFNTFYWTAQELCELFNHARLSQ